MVAALGEQITMVHHARDRGWDSLFTGQHYLNEGDNQQFQIVPFLTRLMPEAGEMTIGLGILLINLHNPVYVAETVATMDIFAKGNFIFGIGLGYDLTGSYQLSFITVVGLLTVALICAVKLQPSEATETTTGS